MARAVQRPAEDIPAKRIGAQKVVPTGRLKASSDHVERRMAGHPRSRDGGGQPKEHKPDTTMRGGVIQRGKVARERGMAVMGQPSLT